MTDTRIPVALVVIIDVILVSVFCTIGRLSHAEGVLSDIPGLLNTTWPFLVALLVAHAVMLIRRTPADRMLPGAVIWAVTVVVGLSLRALSGQGTALAFMIVATLTLALFLIGWRAVVALARRMRRRRAA
ncbi:DUF3054 domain-containing protein [Microbacterium sp. TWP3-1-2b2]|uniref:DUF3054 domain-containing protein n=1 Tax=Microbacterium sp. TWP3-1-2b2 TaxID=2804651 RepID=UPI003CF86159